MAGKSRKSKARKADGTAGDAELLRHAFADVTPLPGREISDRPAAPPPSAAPKPRPKGGAKAAQPATPPAPPKPALPELAPGDAPGVDKRTAQRLRRGTMDIEARLDLHGLHQDQAFVALQSFIASSQSSGKRCVLVITGKGLRPAEGRTGVLREQVPKWLNRPGLRERILSFRPAQPKDGGGGALYVLLKRTRAS